MKIETIVNAMMRVNNNLILVGPLHKKHLANLRQYAAFRARILRIDAEKDAVNEMLRNKIASLERAILFRETGK